jgi:hypothetical protein
VEIEARGVCFVVLVDIGHLAFQRFGRLGDLLPHTTMELRVAANFVKQPAESVRYQNVWQFRQPVELERLGGLGVNADQHAALGGFLGFLDGQLKVLEKDIVEIHHQHFAGFQHADFVRMLEDILEAELKGFGTFDLAGGQVSSGEHVSSPMRTVPP